MPYLNKCVVRPTEDTPILVIEVDRYVRDNRVAITFYEFMNEHRTRPMTVSAPDIPLPGSNWTLIDARYASCVVALKRQGLITEVGEPIACHDGKQTVIPVRVSLELTVMADA